jgi:hypothetical protein
LEIIKYQLHCGAVALAAPIGTGLSAAPSCTGRRLSKPWRRPLIQIDEWQVIARGMRIKLYAALQR